MTKALLQFELLIVYLYDNQNKKLIMISDYSKNFKPKFIKHYLNNLQTEARTYRHNDKADRFHCKSEH